MVTVESIAAVRQQLREQMPVAQKWAYFDHAAVGPISQPAADAVARWSDVALLEGDTQWPTWNASLEATRAQAGDMVNAHTDEIALVPSTTAGVNIVAEGMPWQSGDNVVIAANEFPTNQYPWLNLQSRGVEVRCFEPSEDGAIAPDSVAELCDRRTRIVSLSWVGFASGYRLNPKLFAEVAHDAGALFFLDAIQGLGVFPLDVRESGVDFFAADGHKWMLGPEGAGLFYLKKQHLDLLRPTGLGWNSVARRHDFNHIELKLRDRAARFEGGSHNMVGFHALGASLKLFADCGLSSRGSPLAEAVLHIATHAADQLREIGAQLTRPRDETCQSGIICFAKPGQDPQQLREKCLAAGVALACRDGRLRISPHAYNNEEDVARLIDVLSGP